MSLPMLPAPEAALPPWPETRPLDDPVLAARGLVFSVAFSLPIWFAVLTLLWWALD